MHRRRLCAMLAAAAYAIFAAPPDERWAPSYNPASVLNLASGRPELAPNTLAVIYGNNLSSTVASRMDAAPNAAVLPTVLAGSGVTVKVNGLLAAIEYVSPAAVVFIVPPELMPGPASIVLTRNGLNGPSVRVQLQEAAPALMPLESSWVLARDAVSVEWRTPELPAAPGDEVILYGTGWGEVIRRLINLQPAFTRSELRARSSLRAYLDGMEVPQSSIAYAGVSPGTAGIYELRFRLPEWVPDDPEIRLSIGGRLTQPGLRLRVARSGPQPSAGWLRSNQ